MPIVEYLCVDHVIDGLIGAFYITIDYWVISACGLENNFMVKKYFHEVHLLGNLATLIVMEYGALVDIVAVEIDELID